MVFIDEIQRVDGWEEVVGSLVAEKCFKLFITRSNSRLLSGDYGTHLVGRADEIPVFTLNYSECICFFEVVTGVVDRSAIADRFLKFGGFPRILENIVYLELRSRGYDV